MSEHGRYGGAESPSGERARGFGRDPDRDFERDQPRGRERPGFFGGSRSSAHDRRSRYGRGFDRDEEYFGYDDYHEGLPINETGRLIASNKVEGTPVYGRGGDRLGTI